MLEAAFLDANLFVPTWTLDAFLSLAEARAYEPFWSDKIMEEARVAIQEVRQVSKQQAQQVLDAANKAFPMALTQGWETLEQDIALPDIDDRHVLAAARLAGAQTIVTFNLKHFPQSALAPVGLEVQSPDAFFESHVRWGAGIMRSSDARSGKQQTSPSPHYARGNRTSQPHRSSRIRSPFGRNKLVRSHSPFALSNRLSNHRLNGRFPSPSRILGPFKGQASYWCYT